MKAWLVQRHLVSVNVQPPKSALVVHVREHAASTH